MKSRLVAAIKTFNNMKCSPLPGAFERNLEKQMLSEEGEDAVFFKSIELHTKRQSRRPTEKFADLRVRILTELCEFLYRRFETDEVFLQKIEPFINFDSDADIEEIHSLIAPDISLPKLYMQYSDFSTGNAFKDMSLNEIILKLSKNENSQEAYKELITVLARIVACTPHSADVERMIQANKRLKTKLRASMSLDTENKYLYIHTNMPNLAQWNPQKAAEMFIGEKDRRNRDMTPTNEVTRRQPVFQGIFSEARDCNYKDGDDDEIEAEDFGNTIFEF